MAFGRAPEIAISMCAGSCICCQGRWITLRADRTQMFSLQPTCSTWVAAGTHDRRMRIEHVALWTEDDASPRGGALEAALSD